MLEATLSDGNGFRTVIEAIADMFPNTALMGTPNGFSIQGMDEAHVALVTYRVAAENLTDFQCERNVTLGIHTKTLASVLHHVDKDTSSVALRYDESADQGSFLVTIRHGPTRTSEYSLRLSTTAPEIAHIPTQNYKAVVRIPSSYLLKACKDFTHFGDTVGVEVVGAPAAYVEFCGKGDMGSGALRFGSTMVMSTHSSPLRSHLSPRRRRTPRRRTL
jgi:proliferating cell nuclear antigen